MDVVFDDKGRVETTRFRFQHQPLKYQSDYIAGLVETRKAADVFAQRLTANNYQDVKEEIEQEEKTRETNVYKKLRKNFLSLLGASDADD